MTLSFSLSLTYSISGEWDSLSSSYIENILKKIINVSSDGNYEFRVISTLKIVMLSEIVIIRKIKVSGV